MGYLSPMKTIIAAQTADLVTFVAMVLMFGIAAEANPVLVSLYAAGGFAAIVAAKLIMTGAMVRARAHRVVLVASVALGIIGAASNIAYIVTMANRAA